MFWKNWPGLHIEPLQAPENMEVLIGWTGSPASSPHLVSEVKRLKSDPSFYGFLDQSHACVESLIQAFKTNNIKGVQKMIRINRRIIQSMDNEASVEIETDKLKNYVMSVKSTVALLKLQVLVVAIAALLLSIR